jgi:hypothetical protein
MNALRSLVLLLAGGALFCGSYALAQAEIDPDHYETPAHKVELPKAAHSKQSANHNHQNRMASNRHSGGRNHHHHSKASA